MSIVIMNFNVLVKGNERVWLLVVLGIFQPYNNQSVEEPRRVDIVPLYGKVVNKTGCS